MDGVHRVDGVDGFRFTRFFHGDSCTRSVACYWQLGRLSNSSFAQC